MKSFKFSDLAEFLISLFFVGAVIGGLTFWAQKHVSPPVSYAKEATIELLPSGATIEGTIKLYPTTLEDQEKDFTHHHGRKVLEEQQNRKAGNWTDIESLLSWTFTTESPQKYQLSLTYSSDSEGGKIQATLNNKTFPGILENTEGENSWRSLNLGEVELPAGTHTLTLKGTELVGEELLRLESVTLKP